VSNGQPERPYSSSIQVHNGQEWGTWENREMCPDGTYAIGFNLKVERSIGNGDDTALNGIALHCGKPSSGPLSYAIVQSHVGSWGTWTQTLDCKGGVLQGFQLRVERSQGRGDDTAANNI
ncbi:vitelline membrane outer layer protein 1-like, partial [Clarias magur]